MSQYSGGEAPPEGGEVFFGRRANVGGGSAIDTAKAASAETGLPLVSVPTTYSGAEWASTFGIRTSERGIA